MERRDFLKTTGLGVVALAGAGIESGCNIPPWINTVEGIVQFGGDTALQVVGALDPAISPLMQQVQKGFDLLLADLKQYEADLQASGASTTAWQAVQLAFADLKTDVAGFLAAFTTSASAKDTVISLIVGLIASAISNIASLISANAPAQIAKTLAAVPATFPQANGWDGKDLRSRFDSIVSKDTRFHKE